MTTWLANCIRISAQPFRVAESLGRRPPPRTRTLSTTSIVGTLCQLVVAHAGTFYSCTIAASVARRQRSEDNQTASSSLPSRQARQVLHHAGQTRARSGAPCQAHYTGLVGRPDRLGLLGLPRTGRSWLMRTGSTDPGSRLPGAHKWRVCNRWAHAEQSAG